MPLDWLNTPLDADIGELLARKKRGKAIESLRRQLQGRLAPPVTVRLQLADLLMQAGRIEEAVPVLLGLADEFAADGFVAKAVAILKRVDRVQPGRADIAERLEKLVHQQKRVANLPLPSPRASATPEFGMEEIGEESLDTPAGFDEAVELPPDAPPSPPMPPSEPMAAELEVEPNAEPMAEEIRASPVDPILEATPIEPALDEAVVPAIAADATETRSIEPDAPPPTLESPSDPIADLVASGAAPPAAPAEDVVISVDSASAGEGEPVVAMTDSAAGLIDGASGEGTDDAAATGPGVGRRIRRALWRFLSSLPGAEEGAAAEPLPVDDGVPVAAPEGAAVEATALSDEPSPSSPTEPPAGEPVPSEAPASEPPPAAAVPAPDVPEPIAPSLTDLAGDDALLGLIPPAGEDAMSEDTFRQKLLDIVEDVLHRPPPPEVAEAVDRARALDIARRMVASRLFKDLSDEELLAIVRGLRLHTYEAGDIVVTEGEPGQSLFTLTTGRVKVFVENPDHRNFEVAALAEGDFFGEISSLSGRPRTATVVAAGICELLELDRPTLDSIARTHARVRDVLESSYIARASSPEAAAVRAVLLPDSGTRRKAIEVLESHFGESRWDPRMRLRLADVLLKAGKDEDAIPILVGLADELAREGFADKAVAIIKKIEQVQRRNVEVVNLAPLLKAARPRPEPARSDTPASPRPRAITDDRFHGWLVDLVKDTVGRPQAASASSTSPPALKAYGPGLLANPLFEDFSEEELLAFIHGLRLLSFEPGDVIITEGEAGQSVFILASGEVKVFVCGPDGRNVMLGRLGEGSFFGEISTLSGRPRSATITAAAACDILELDRAALDAISATHPRVRTVLETFSEARSADPEAARARGRRPSA